jgi:parallel beta-helix repeat protein
MPEVPGSELRELAQMPEMEDFMTRTYSPAKLRLAIWFSALALALAFGAPEMSATTVTYIVGTCVSGTHFSTIQAALDASPAPNTVEVCPGQYGEQITITKPVTLEGIAAGDGSLAEIGIPANYTANARVEGGSASAIAQIYVDHVSGGSVNLSNLAVTGDGFGALDGQGADFFIGVVYEESSGTVNQVMTWAQDNNSGNHDVNGWGIWIEGGSSNPSVTVENSSVHNFSSGGIFAIGETTAPDLTVAIKNNFVSSVYEGDNNIVVYQGTNPTVSGNTVIGGVYGIFITSPTGSITGNTFLGSQTGIALTADGPSVTSNNVYGATEYGIAVSATLKKSIVEKNIIRNVQSASSSDSDGTGIELGCNNISSSQVNSNTIIDAFAGYGDAPAGFAGSNTYVGLFSDIATCASDSVSRKASPAPRLKLLGQLREQ